MMKTAFLCNSPDNIDRVYGPEHRAAIAAQSTLYPTVVTSDTLAEHTEALADVEALFSTWGMPSLTAEDLDHLPSLKALFYAAGSVRGFAQPFLDRGVTVVSAWAANAIPVAEFALAQILLACKGYFRNVPEYHRFCADRRAVPFIGPGVYGEAIALLGAGMVARKLIELLRPFNLRILVHDPYLDPEIAKTLGVELVSMAEAFQRGLVVSNHIPNLPETVGLLNEPFFASMRPNAVFLNTGRGATVVEPDLVRVFTARTDLTALLDVTLPEPPPADSPLLTLPNVHLSAHIAGSIGDEVRRMAHFCVEEFSAWQEGRPLKYAVSQDMLEKMA